jgi:hypothetical protein
MLADTLSAAVFGAVQQTDAVFKHRAAGLNVSLLSHLTSCFVIGQVNAFAPAGRDGLVNGRI